MRIRYLVPKEYICTPEKSEELTLQQRKDLPADVQLKIIDASRVARQPAAAQDVRLKPATMDVTYFPKTLRTKASWLLSELASKGLKWNERGELYNHDTLMPGTNILELTNDVLRERKRSNPQGWQHFAQILHNYNVPKNLIQNSKRLIMTPTPEPPQYAGMDERGMSDESNESFNSLADFEDLFANRM